MTLIRDRVDQLINIFLILGRQANQVALRASGTLLEIRNVTDTAYADMRAKNIQFDGYPVTARVFGIRKRQCVISGPIDSNGLPNIISAPGGLNAQINASATSPIRCTFAAGLDGSGAIDYIGQDYASIQGFSGLAANTTHYFYLERNPSTGALTPTRITIAPVYSRIAPSSPATGLHWFNTSQNSNTTLPNPGMTLYEWSGSVWVPRQRVFIGEVTTGASAVTSFATYAYERRYQSAWTAATTNQAINFAHNLGMTPAEAESRLTFFGRQNSSDLAHVFVPPGFYVGSSGYGVLCYGVGGRLSQTVLTGDVGIYFSGGWLSSVNLMCSIDSAW